MTETQETPEKESTKRVVLHGADAKIYVGDIEPEEMSKLSRLEPCKLLDVYQLVVVDQHVIHPQTQAFGGMSRSYIIMNVGTADGSLPELNVQPTAWYDPETCGVAENFNTLIEQVEKAKMRKEQGGGPEIIRAGAGALQALQGRGRMSLKPNGK